MTQYKYGVNGSAEIGNLTWNTNGSLKTLVITDPFNAGDAQTCNYAQDDLARISSVNCGTPWAQTFTYDPFGNVTKSGSISWQPGYSSSTNRYTLAGTSYDANGNLLKDSFHTYTVDVNGRPLTIDSVGLTYDAFGRMVEQNQSGTYYEIVYDPLGRKLGIFNGATVQQFYVPLPGGAFAEYLSWGLSHYRHSDWLGTDRLETGASDHSIKDNNAYAPFGEPYAQIGNGEISFTGQNKDTTWLQYDFLARQYDPKQGRWIAPDPAGPRIANPGNPQTWNAYTYVANNPISRIDPLGLFMLAGAPSASDLPDAPQCQICGQDYYGVGGTATLVFDGKEAQRSSKQFGTLDLTTGVDTSDIDITDDIAANIQALAPAMQQGAATANTIVGLDATLAGAMTTFAGGVEVLPTVANRVLFGPALNRVFWSGAGYFGARAYAFTTEGTTLETTPVGTLLENVGEYLPWKVMQPMWRWASTNYAAGAEGNVLMFKGLNGYTGQTWNTIESLILDGRYTYIY